MSYTIVKLPDGNISPDLLAALAALDDPKHWEDPSSEMYLYVRDGDAACQLTVVRRGVRVCVSCYELGEDPPGFISVGGDQGDDWYPVHLQDVTVFYPSTNFVPLREGRRVVEIFARTLKRTADIEWEAFDLGGLGFHYFEDGEP